MLTPVCPLCQSKDSSHQLINELNSKDLVKLFQTKAGIDITKCSSIADHEKIFIWRCSQTGLLFFHPSTPGNSDLYMELANSNWYYSESKPEFTFASQYVDSKNRVLEIGCGEGFWTEGLNCLEYVGIELNPVARGKAQQKGLHIIGEPLAEHAANNIAYYDIVAAFQVLEHIDDIYQFVDDCLACIKPGGFLIYSVPSSDSFVSLAPNNFMNLPPHHLSWWSDQALRSLVDMFELELIALNHERLSPEHLHWYNYTLTFNKIIHFLGFKEKKIYTGIPFLAISQTANFVAFLLDRLPVDEAKTPDGHSVTVVYRKPAS